MIARRLCWTLCLAVMGVVHAALPAPALAQWYLDAEIGANHSHNADVSIRLPSADLSLDFHDVQFSAQSNYPRRYYVLRIGRFGKGRLGWEVEQIHLKAVADVTRSYDVTVSPGSTLPPGGAQPMNLVVQEYQMTHGVNLAVVNAVLRTPIAGLDPSRVAVTWRLGVGASFPHGETTVNGGGVHTYQYGGPGGQAAVGLRIGVIPRVAAIAEYKFTYTRPKIDVAGGGEGWTSLWSHHVAVGFSLGLTR